MAALRKTLKKHRGQFKPGKGRGNGTGGGRAKGTGNRTSKMLKDAISGAAENLGMLIPIYKTLRNGRKSQVIIGWEPSGKGGTQGYLVWLGCNYPTAFATLLAKLLPLQIYAQLQGGDKTVSERFAKVNIDNMTLTEKMAAMQEMVSLTRPIAPPEQGNGNGQIIDGKASRIR